MLTARLLNLLAFTGLALAWVDLDPALIPVVPAKLPVYALGPPSFIPKDVLADITGNSAWHGTNHTYATRQDTSREVVYNSEGQAAGAINYENGQQQFANGIGALPPSSSPGPIDTSSNPQISDVGRTSIPTDDTGTERTQGSSLQGSENTQASGVARRHNDGDLTYLTLAAFRRFVDVDGQKFPVCGPGSQAIFGVDANNRVATLSFFWKPAKKDGKTCQALSVDEVAKRIKEALEEKHCKDGRAVKVYSVDACFYDSGDQFIQPVYRVFSELYDHKTNGAVPSKGFLDYVPVGNEIFEPIDRPRSAYYDAVQQPEQAGEPSGDAPVERSLLSYFDARQYRRWSKPTVKVGIYVVRNDIIDFVVDAWSFWRALEGSTIINFVRKQYIWSWPWVFNRWAKWFVNSVDLALVEAYGNINGFTTDSSRTDVDFVRIPQDINPGGFGKSSDGGKGCLSYLILNAGNALPTTPSDFGETGIPQNEIVKRVNDKWAPVFQGGLHAAMSWRTSTLESDNVARSWAEDVALFNPPVVDAWLFQAHADPAYSAGLITPGLGAGGGRRPLGRAAVIFRCERPSDTVTDLEKLGAPNCLSVRYWGD